MPMMMHHDAQPLYSRGTNYGLLNQIKILRKAGAASLQVLMLTPAAGSKLLEPTFKSGQVFKSVSGKKVLPSMYDGNYVVASLHKRPWQKQFTMIAGYAYFYNPVWFIMNLIKGRSSVNVKTAGMQLVGMAGLLLTIMRTTGWAIRLMWGKIDRFTAPPPSRFPMRSPRGEEASHPNFRAPKIEVELHQVRVRVPSREMVGQA
jgi:hypothetical protein